MKVFSFFDPVVPYDYPKDMEKILKYLESEGTLRVTGKCVEDMYRKFSEEHCASWLSADYNLRAFAIWLSQQDLEEVTAKWVK